MLLKQLKLRPLSVLETTAFPDLGPAANHGLPALYALLVSRGALIKASPASAPSSPSTTLFVNVISFFSPRHLSILGHLYFALAEMKVKALEVHFVTEVRDASACIPITTL